MTRLAVWVNRGHGSLIERLKMHSRPLTVMALIFLAAVVPYLATLDNEFIWDSISIIQENPLIRDPENFTNFFTMSYWDRGQGATAGNYRPLLNVSYLLNYLIAGPSALVFRGINILLHALVSMLVYNLARKLGAEVWPALIGGLIFAVHPVHSEPVIWIVGRAEILAGLFVLLSFSAYIDFFERGAQWKLFASVVLFGLGLLCKESAAIVPGLTFAHAGISMLAKKQPNLGRSFVGTTLLVAVLILYFIVRLEVLGTIGDNSEPGFFTAATPVEVAGTMVKVLAWAWALLLFPLWLSPHYDQLDFPIPTSIFDPTLILSFVALGGIIWFAIKLTRSGNVLGSFGIVWVFIAFSPYSHVLSFQWLFGERFLYIPSIGLSILASAVLLPVVGRKAQRGSLGRRIAWVALAIGLVLLSVRTYVQDNIWQNNITLFELMVTEKPDLAGAHYALAEAYARKGQLHDARREYSEVVRLLPDFEEAGRRLNQLHAYLGK
jgi:hypothetical protein